MSDIPQFWTIIPDKGRYRFGFNGQEKDDEITGNTGSHLDFGARIYDSRIGRWMVIDPLAAKYPNYSPYNFVGNSPIIAIDKEGKDIYIIISNAESGTTEIQKVNIEQVIYKMASTQMGEEFIQKYVNNPNEDVYITVGKCTSDNSLATTRRAFRGDEFVNPETVEIGTHSILTDEGLPEFKGVEIDAEKKNYFIIMNNDDFGSKEINSELSLKRGAKILGHEFGAHLKDKRQKRKDEEHDAWGQKHYDAFEVDKGSKADQYNKQVDKSNTSSEKYKTSDQGRGKYKIEEKK
jgi:RHS repeat-associated protein